MSIGYVLHDLSMFSPPEEIKALLDELRTEPDPSEQLQRQIDELEQILQEAEKLREDIAQVKHLTKEEISSLRENKAELVAFAKARMK